MLPIQDAKHWWLQWGGCYFTLRLCGFLWLYQFLNYLSTNEVRSERALLGVVFAAILFSWVFSKSSKMCFYLLPLLHILSIVPTCHVAQLTHKFRHVTSAGQRDPTSSPPAPPPPSLPYFHLDLDYSASWKGRPQLKANKCFLLVLSFQGPRST